MRRAVSIPERELAIRNVCSRGTNLVVGPAKPPCRVRNRVGSAEQMIERRVEELLRAQIGLNREAAERIAPFRLRVASHAREIKVTDLVRSGLRTRVIACGESRDDGQRVRITHAEVEDIARRFLADIAFGELRDRERLVAETTAAAVAALAELPGDTAFLSALARKLVGRTV